MPLSLVNVLTFFSKQSCIATATSGKHGWGGGGGLQFDFPSRHSFPSPPQTLPAPPLHFSLLLAPAVLLSVSSVLSLSLSLSYLCVSLSLYLRVSISVSVSQSLSLCLYLCICVSVSVSIVSLCLHLHLYLCVSVCLMLLSLPGAFVSSASSADIGLLSVSLDWPKSLTSHQFSMAKVAEARRMRNPVATYRWHMVRRIIGSKCLSYASR